MTYETVIGLEVHAELLTASKIFCGCANKFGAEANSQVCPVCSGMPGALPVLNRKAVEFAIAMGLATDCRINATSVFARKNYFYPDLPKAYQISQYDRPLCEKGHIDIEVSGQVKRIDLNRIHMEEDAGKSIHDRGEETLVDFNRCGTPLIEIVTEADLRSPQEAYAYLVKIRQLLQYTGVCDGKMEEGSLRCDANISLRPVGQKAFGTKTELKNMNSFRNVERALEYEVNRQRELLESGGTVVQESLLWDADKGTARSMRSKEDAHDYRYFPDPDLMAVQVNDVWIESVRKGLPELPAARCKRFADEFGLPAYDAGVLTESKAVADYYEAALKANKNPKAISNWVMGDCLRTMNEKKIEITALKVTPEALGKLVKMVESNVISGKIAKTVFDEMAENGGDPEAIVKSKGLMQLSDTGAIESAVREVLARSADEVAKFKAGKANLMGYFVGEVMKTTRGKANPKVVNEILQRLLAE
ncbi:MAG: Asp-tRNA(Asn)/Glu-tRNA(Gln) amidotransferase subunit GatB [Fibrobacterota bacterium]